MKRRDFMGVAAAAVALPTVAKAARMDPSTIKTRKAGKVEIVYKAPHSKPNGLQATPEGLWVMDQGPESYVSLVNFADGKVIREFKTAPDVVAASGVTVDAGNVMWLTATHNNLIVTCSPQDGKIMDKYWTPGAGRIYPKAGDPPAARSPLPPAYPATPSDGAPRRARLAPGHLPQDTADGMGGTGAHGIENRDGLLYFANPPARLVFVMEPKTWVVQDAWPVPGNRPHGVAWDGDTLWVADSNLRAFFRHNYKTGEIVEKIQLTEKDPLIHGATSRGDGYLWYCDDMGYICKLKLS
jgi:streptogramin lyase